MTEIKVTNGRRPYFTERSLAEYLSVGTRTVRRWWQSGELPSYKIHGARRFSPTDVDAFVAAYRDQGIRR